MTIGGTELLKLSEERLDRRAKLHDEVQISQWLSHNISILDLQAGKGNTTVSTWFGREAWPFTAAQPALYVIEADSPQTASAIQAAFPKAQPPPKKERTYAMHFARGASAIQIEGSPYITVSLCAVHGPHADGPNSRHRGRAVGSEGASVREAWG